ncbi:phenol 2-monooxygenase [Pseudonocardia sp. WMMC193]|uniref:phenol 2-monooxygenase n=1 Tax=Pseudonocardia sp. WMMC193 TaxID=2911965 RepID=UPI001F42A64D|nr:phenol 2-monooxygenase [Pseudonocardia sp. WMMC193]MCF7550853.1 phenol 2-monooxygenase [Pseudonocardia sp. WMMC193]
MSYELRTQTIEPRRNAFTHLVERFGDRPPSRYQEATFDVQATENFHYRPYWAPDREPYDPDYTALKLTDPYDYSDPRQFYYATWVTARAEHYDAFAKTLAYVEQRGLLGALGEGWQALLVEVVLPLRHYESAAQLISSNGCRFAWGTSISQPVGLAAMDRIGNAQLLSTVGLALSGGGTDSLAAAKTAWVEREGAQALRRYTEEAMVAEDWAEGVLAVELLDSLVYPVLFGHLERESLGAGAPAYSLLAQHFGTWYADQRRWLDPLLTAWADDPEHGAANREFLAAVAARWAPAALTAFRGLVDGVDPALPDLRAATSQAAADLTARLDKLGVTAPELD